MHKIVKWAAIGSLGLVLLVLLILALAPLFLPLKSIIIDNLAEQTGRPVKLAEVRLGLLGGADLELKGLEIGELEPYGDRPLLRLRSLNCQFSLLPLLADTLALGQCRVDGLELSVARAADGRLNIDDMPAMRKARAQPRSSGESPARHEPPTESLPHLLLGRTEISGTKLFLANLATGRTAVWPVTQAVISTDLRDKNPDVDARVNAPGLVLSITTAPTGPAAPREIKASVDLAELGRRAAVVWPGLESRGTADLMLEAKGPIDETTISGSLLAKGLYLKAPGAGSPPVDLADARLELTMLTRPKVQSIELQKFTLVSRAAGYRLEARGSLSPGKARGSLSQRVELAKLARAMAPLLPKGMELSGTSTKRLDLHGDMKSIAVEGQSRLDDLRLKLPGMKRPFSQKSMVADFRGVFDAKGNLALEAMDLDSRAAKLRLTGRMRLGRPLKGELKLAAQYLDLDALAPLVEASQAAAPGGRASAPARDAAKAPEPANELRAFLDESDISLDTEIKSLRYGGIEVNDVRAATVIGKGKAAFDDVRCKLFDGAIKARASLEADTPRIEGRAEAEVLGLSITPERYAALRRAFPVFNFPAQLEQGKIDMDSNLHWQGLTKAAILADLGGKGTFGIRDGVRVSFDALDRMEGGAMLHPLLHGNIPDFYGRLDGSYTIEKGRVRFKLDFTESREDINVGLSGVTTLADGKVEAGLTLSGEGLGRDLKMVLGPDGSVPLKITGTVDRPVAEPQITTGVVRGIRNLLGE